MEAISWLSRFHVNPSLVRIEEFVRECAASMQPGARVLDAGAGDCRYRSLFEQHQYQAADFAEVKGKRYGELDYVCDLSELPVPDGCFDAVICTQVLAHLPEPKKSLNEIHRVLKRGGKLWLTCPLSFQENEQPYDFYRYTRFGLRYLMEEAGFVVERLDPVETYLGTLQYHLGMAAMRLPLRPSGYGGGVRGWLAAGVAIVAKPVFAASCQFYTWLELSGASQVNGMNVNWQVTAVKS